MNYLIVHCTTHCTTHHSDMLIINYLVTGQDDKYHRRVLQIPKESLNSDYNFAIKPHWHDGRLHITMKFNTSRDTLRSVNDIETITFSNKWPDNDTKCRTLCKENERKDYKSVHLISEIDQSISLNNQEIKAIESQNLESHRTRGGTDSTGPQSVTLAEYKPGSLTIMGSDLQSVISSFDVRLQWAILRDPYHIDHMPSCDNNSMTKNENVGKKRKT